MKKFMIAAASAASVLPVLAEDPSAPGDGVGFITQAAQEIGTYNAPIVGLLTACFAIVMIFVGYKIAKRSVAKA